MQNEFRRTCLSIEINFVRAFMLVWGAFGVIWLACAPFVKRRQRDTSNALRVVRSLVMIAGSALLTPIGNLGWLNRHLYATTLALAWTGLLLTVVGVVWAIWARLALGRNWSGNPMLKQDHELVVGGPYAITRHPIYSGLILAFLGSGLALCEYRSLLGLALLLGAILIKIRQEERLMIEAFPVQYPDYRRRVKALVPFLW
jgi:protein-S-isoprenylcysteine O-methyltransferase Ste14